MESAKDPRAAKGGASRAREGEDLLSLRAVLKTGPRRPTTVNELLDYLASL